MMNKDPKAYPVVPDCENDRRGGGDYIELPGGSRVAPNGAVIEEPANSLPEVLPPNEFTPEKEDLDLLIM